VKLFFTRRAARDLDDIWQRIALDSEAAADRMLDEIQERCRLLATQPGMGESCTHYGKGMRRTTVGWYVVLYRAQPKQVSIARVLHGARDIDSLF
jgi:toxin ParE1/3/4